MPQCAITHSGSNSSAFRKHLTPSALLKAKHQFKPRSNQRWVSGEPVETILEWLPRLKRSILFSSSIAPGSYLLRNWTTDAYHLALPTGDSFSLCLDN